MGKNKVRRQDQSKMSLRSKTTTTDKHIPPSPPTPRRISTNRTCFDAYIRPAIAIAMQEYQLLCGIVIAVWVTLFAVLRQIYIPTTITPRSKVKTVKGKKGKAQRKPVAVASQKSEPVDSASPLPLQATVLQALSSARSSAASESAASAQTPLPSSPPPSGSPANMGIKQVQPALPDETSSAQAPQSILGIPSPGIDANVKRPSLIPLSETMMLFKLVEEGNSEEAVSTNTSHPNITPRT